MSKILKHILFSTVLLVIVLHSIIQHPHSDELTEEKHFKLHKESNSLFGIIRLVFHESDDEGLDNLIFTQHEGDKKIDSKYKYLNSILKNTTSIVGEKTIERNSNNFDKLLFVKLNGLRGPPIINLINSVFKI